MNLSFIEDVAERLLAEVEMTPEAFAALPAPFLSNGFYTLTLPDGGHRTFRVRLERSGIFAGKRTLSLLIGPDNTSDYETQATVGVNGFEFFKRFCGDRTVYYGEVIWHIARGGTRDGYTLLVSKRCRLCNRPLSTPEAIQKELGATCAARLGL